MTAVSGVGKRRCGWCGAAETLVDVGWEEQVSGLPLRHFACDHCVAVHEFVPRSEHPEGWSGAVMYRDELAPVPVPAGSGGTERDFAREVTGLGAAVVWETTRRVPDWPAVRELAEKLLRTALQASADGVEEPDSVPVAVADIAKARRLVPKARHHFDDVERAVSREPCDVALAYELAGALAGTVGVVLLILRSLSGEAER